MYNEIRKIVKDGLEGINARILFGTVSSVDPFKVLVEKRLELPGKVLIFPEHLQEVKLVTKDLEEYILREKLCLNDRLILINLGQQYLIFDKVGDFDATISITPK
ncbi:hypothetical protein SH2C18_39530 [Clostridium sediminicola]|uniref:DUF2577 family protein n=1 Tax=Clostridium sediminicola TaxID=3114879 RepID=UPI0031F26F20